MRAVVRLVLALAAGAAVALFAERLGVRRALAALFGGVVAITPGLFLLFVPRAAHRAFERGEVGRAAFFYRVLAAFVLERRTRGAIRISLAACRLADERWEQALAALGAVDPADLDVAGRSTWHNNRAYALARAGRVDAAALEQVDEAIRLRPDVAGFRHTRGLVLLGLGRVDEAIRELEGVWSELGDDAAPLLEAERCYDLGTAWQRKGERDYGRDYLGRAVRLAPQGHWIGKRAAAALASSPPP